MQFRKAQWNKKGTFKGKQIDTNIIKAQERIEKILGLKVNILNKKDWDLFLNALNININYIKNTKMKNLFVILVCFFIYLSANADEIKIENNN